MKDVIKMLKAIEKELAKAIKLAGKPAVKAVAKKATTKRDGKKLEKIRAMLAAGKPVTEIAAKVGVTAPYVYGIRSKDKKAAE